MINQHIEDDGLSHLPTLPIQEKQLFFGYQFWLLIFET